MDRPLNPYLYPLEGPRLGYTYRTPRERDTRARILAPLTGLDMARHRIARTLWEAGYARPTQAAWAAALGVEHTYHRSLDMDETNVRFPTGPTHGVQIALIDAHWNRRYVSPQPVIADTTQWDQTHVTTRTLTLDLWLDLHTGHWCVFDADPSLGGPLGDGYMHQSPATRYPQPTGGTHAHP